MPRPSFITQASRPSPGLSRYEASCALFGAGLLVLGRSEPVQGQIQRLMRLRDHLVTRGADEIVLFTDAANVVLLRDPDGLTDCFERFGAPIVFACEPGFTYRLPGGWGVSRRYPPAGGKSGMYRFLNAGAMIGRVGALRRMLGELDTDIPVDCAHTVLHAWFLAHPGRAALDYDQEIFATSACQAGLETRLFAVREGLLCHRRTGAAPYFMHFPAENRICSNRLLDMMPWMRNLPRLPVRGRDRSGYLVNCIENGLSWLLDRPAYPLNDWVRVVLFYLLPGLVAAGLAWLCLL
ncbi:glycosyltransferase domain-containing protein [Stappia indica]|uniref:glycosyltransferase domain-containing protein n=1 Tax=Stappia indica TaxID=538381 RepID=UPI001CD67160|nr:glycosyltransferase domain-containing protein [Stappia indica]MCA1299367.1 hypothetical protein [Stappia indica]